MGFAAVALLLEALAGVSLARGIPLGALALHVAASGTLAEGFAGRTRHARPALGTGWFWALAFPGFGVLAGALVLLLRSTKGRAVYGESWEERRSKAARRALEEKQLEQHVRADVVPLVDALRADDAALRISAMEALRDRDSKPVVMLLARARQNTVYDVRFRAVEHLGRINDQSLERIAAAERAVQATPDAPELHHRLARLCFEHADLGLDTEQVTRSYFARTIVHAERSLARGLHADGLILLANAFWRLGVLDRAEIELRRAHELEPHHAEALLGIAQLQFARKDFVALQRTCKLILEQRVHLSKKQRQAVQLYAGRRAEPESWPPSR